MQEHQLVMPWDRQPDDAEALGDAEARWEALHVALHLAGTGAAGRLARLVFEQTALGLGVWQAEIAVVRGHAAGPRWGRTFFLRAKALLIAEGILAVELAERIGRATVMAWRIDWRHVRLWLAIARQSPELMENFQSPCRPERWSPRGVHMESTWSPRGVHMESTSPTETPIPPREPGGERSSHAGTGAKSLSQEVNKSSSSSIVSQAPSSKVHDLLARLPAAADYGPGMHDRVAARCNRVLAAAGTRLNSRHEPTRRLIVTAALMAEAIDDGERWLMETATRVAKARSNAGGYFRRCLESSLWESLRLCGEPEARDLLCEVCARLRSLAERWVAARPAEATP